VLLTPALAYLTLCNINKDTLQLIIGELKN
jgi:hypothetical protein